MTLQKAGSNGFITMFPPDAGWWMSRSPPCTTQDTSFSSLNVLKMQHVGLVLKVWKWHKDLFMLYVGRTTATLCWVTKTPSHLSQKDLWSEKCF